MPQFGGGGKITDSTSRHVVRFRDFQRVQKNVLHIHRYYALLGHESNCFYVETQRNINAVPFAAGSRCKRRLIETASHGFPNKQFNLRRGNPIQETEDDIIASNRDRDVQHGVTSN